jgi:hypothetical protein
MNHLTYLDSDDEIEVFTCDKCLRDFITEDQVKQHIIDSHKTNPVKRIITQEPEVLTDDIQKMKLPKKMKQGLLTLKVKKMVVLND